ncbi:MAG: nitrate reductase associated protein [Candidatus Binatus sp.]
MIRKFKFEAEIYEWLNCLPMAARRKLDAVGIKLHLAQWEQLGRGERLMICHAPADSEEEQSALRTFIEEVALARTGSPAKTLPDDTRRSANPPDRPPQILAHHARVAGVELDDKAWAALDDDQRYALIKLGDSERPSHNLELALQEFLDNGAQTEAS